MLPPKELGIKGEEIAAGYLKKEGYKILARNWFYDHKEIDIIADRLDIEVEKITYYFFPHRLSNSTIKEYLAKKK